MLVLSGIDECPEIKKLKNFVVRKNHMNYVPNARSQDTDCLIMAQLTPSS